MSTAPEEDTTTKLFYTPYINGAETLAVVFVFNFSIFLLAGIAFVLFLRKCTGLWAPKFIHNTTKYKFSRYDVLSPRSLTIHRIDHPYKHDTNEESRTQEFPSFNERMELFNDEQNTKDLALNYRQYRLMQSKFIMKKQEKRETKALIRATEDERLTKVQPLSPQQQSSITNNNYDGAINKSTVTVVKFENSNNNNNKSKKNQKEEEKAKKKKKPAKLPTPSMFERLQFVFRLMFPYGKVNESWRFAKACGHETAVYLLFQKVFIFAFLVISIMTVCIVMPLNIASAFSPESPIKKDLVNIRPSLYEITTMGWLLSGYDELYDDKLWTHLALSWIFATVILVALHLWYHSDTVQHYVGAGNESKAPMISEFAVLVKGLPTGKVSTDIMVSSQDLRNLMLIALKHAREQEILTDYHENDADVVMVQQALLEKKRKNDGRPPIRGDEVLLAQVMLPGHVERIRMQEQYEGLAFKQYLFKRLAEEYGKDPKKLALKSRSLCCFCPGLTTAREYFAGKRDAMAEAINAWNAEMTLRGESTAERRKKILDKAKTKSRGHMLSSNGYGVVILESKEAKEKILQAFRSRRLRNIIARDAVNSYELDDSETTCFTKLDIAKKYKNRYISALKKVRVAPAPEPEDIRWSYITKGNSLRYIKAFFSVTLILLLSLAFGILPSAVSTVPNFAAFLKEEDVKNSQLLQIADYTDTLNRILRDYVPSVAIPFINGAIYRLAPSVIVAVFVLLVLPFLVERTVMAEKWVTWSRERQAVMKRTFAFTFICFVFAPLLMLGGIDAAIHLIVAGIPNTYRRLQDEVFHKMFIADAGIFAVSLVITTGFIKLIISMLAPNKYWTAYRARRRAAKIQKTLHDNDDEETLAAEQDVGGGDRGDLEAQRPSPQRSAVPRNANQSAVIAAREPHFKFERAYPFQICFMGLVLSLSVFSPLITSFGLLYLCLQNVIDRYNFVFLYRRSERHLSKSFETYREQIRSTTWMVLACLLCFELTMTLFFAFKANDLISLLPQAIIMAVLIVLTVIYMIYLKICFRYNASWLLKIGKQMSDNARDYDLRKFQTAYLPQFLFEHERNLQGVLKPLIRSFKPNEAQLANNNNNNNGNDDDNDEKIKAEMMNRKPQQQQQ